MTTNSEMTSAQNLPLTLEVFCRKVSSVNGSEEKSDVIKEISLLSLGQKNVRVQIAKGVTKLMSKESILNLQMTSSSILAALASLEEKDIIEEQDQYYQIINPVLKHYVLAAI